MCLIPVDAARLRECGAQLVDEVVRYKDVYRLCYVRGPEGILIGLAASSSGFERTRADSSYVSALGEKTC